MKAIQQRHSIALNTVPNNALDWSAVTFFLNLFYESKIAGIACGSKTGYGGTFSD